MARERERERGKERGRLVHASVMPALVDESGEEKKRNTSTSLPSSRVSASVPDRR